MKRVIRLAVALAAVAAIIYGCGDHGSSPSDPGAVQQSSLRAQTDCGEFVYLTALSPVLTAWEDSIETWRGNTELLNETPGFTGQPTADYLAALVPVLQQWETAINTELDSVIVDAVTDFNPAATNRQDYLFGLSSLLASWEADLEAFRGIAFLPAPPVFQLDETAPEITCIADTTLTCAPSEGVVFEYEVTAVDDCDPAPVVTCDPPSGSLFPVGETLVTCTAVDSLGNESTCTFTVNVEAAEPPVIVSASASPSTIWPPNHKWVDVALDVEVESECDPEVSCTVTEVTSNESPNGKGDGNTSPDWLITDGGVKLRAERSGNGSGRVYTVHFVCEDDFGNSVEGSVDVSVAHDQGGGKK
jgi:hypothetical protein